MLSEGLEIEDGNDAQIKNYQKGKPCYKFSKIDSKGIKFEKLIND